MSDRVAAGSVGDRQVCSGRPDCVGVGRILESAVRDAVIVKVPGIGQGKQDRGRIGELHGKGGITGCDIGGE